MKHAESNFQVQVVRALRAAGLLVFSVPNGQRLNLRRAVLAKAEGLLSGVSDLVVVLPEKVVFAEIKSPDGKGRQSPAQKDFQARVELLGHDYQIWQSWQDVQTFLDKAQGWEQAHALKLGGDRSDEHTCLFEILR